MKNSIIISKRKLTSDVVELKSVKSNIKVTDRRIIIYYLFASK